MLDLLDECGKDLKNCGYITESLGKFKATTSKLFIDSAEKAKRLNFEKGHYFIINAPLLLGLKEEHFSFLKAEIKTRIKFLLKENRVKLKEKILFVGIGNREITADSFGDEVIKKLNISPFQRSNNIYKISPNTFSNTGINAYELIRLLVEGFDISAVVLFDALLTTSTVRLGTSIQINDAGLTPGSALNKFGMPINAEALGVPCLSVGVPFLISAGDLSKKESKDLILTEKDVGEKVDFLSTLVADVFNELIG